MQRNIFTAFLSIAGGRVAVLLISAATTPLLFRALGESEYGQYGTVMAVFGMLMILASSGINSGVRKYLAEERDAAGWERHVFGFYFQVAAGLALLAAIVLLVAAQTGLVAYALDPEYVPLFYLLAVLAIAAQFREYVRRALMGLKLEHVSEPLRVAHKLTFAIAGVGLAVLGYGVWGVLVGEIIASSLVFLVAFAFIAREISPFALFDLPPKGFPWRELFTFNYLSVVYFFLLTSMYHVDVIMIELLGTSAQAGVYRAGLVLVQFLWFVPKSVQSVMIQSTSSLWADQNVERINEIASKVTRYTLLLTLLLAIGLGALASDFVPIYYGNADIVLPVLILLPGTVGFAIARPILAITHAKGALTIVIIATGAAAVLNLVLNRMLIPQYGIAGAAVATTIGYGVLPIFHLLGARKAGYQPLSDVRLVRTLVTAVMAGVPIVALAMLIENPILAMVVVPPVGLLVFSLAAFLTGAVHVDEVLAILTSLPAPVSSRARTLRARLDNSALTDGGRTKVVQYGLLTVGILLFAVGLAVAMGGPIGGILPDGNVTGDPVTETPADDTTSPTDDTTNTGNGRTPTGTAPPTPTPTETDNGGWLDFGGGEGKENPTETSSDTSTPTEADDGGWLDFDGDDDGTNPTVTPTDSPPSTATPSPAPADSPTATDSPTPTDSSPPTATQSPTRTPTTTQPPTSTTQPPTSTDSPTPTDTQSPTPTATASPTSTATTTTMSSSTTGPSPTPSPNPTPTASDTPSGNTSASMVAMQVFTHLLDWLL